MKEIYEKVRKLKIILCTHECFHKKNKKKKGSLFTLRFEAVIVIHNFISASILLSGSIVLFCLSPAHTHTHLH